MARQLKVEIIGDASSLQKAFGKAEDATGSFGKTLGRAAKIAGAAAGAAALGGLFVTMKRGFAEMSEAQQVMAQTGAVLKSTGGAANVTARQVDSLAGSLSRMSGVDDEAIASGENLLLTFTNIRNEAGKNNDIFDQTTKATLDMSVAMGTDMRTAALQVGKALNDPAKGMTRLQRVGVTFTKSQVDLVKQLVKTGHSADAQKVILAELNKEFGGSAKAAGDTFPGQLNKLRNSFDEVAGKIVTGLLPYLQQFVDFINRNMPTIERVMGQVADGIVTAVQVVARVFDTAKTAVTGFLDLIRGAGTQSTLAAAGIAAFAAAVGAAIIVVKAIEVATKAWAAAQLILNAAMAANPFVLLAVAIVALGAALTVAYMKSERFREIVNGAFESVKAVVLPIIDALRRAWSQWGDDLVRVVRATLTPMVTFIRTQLEVLRDVFELVMAVIRGDWGRAWDELKSIVSRTLNGIVNLVRGIVGNILAAALAVGKAVARGILEGIGDIATWLGKKLGGVATAVWGAVKDVWGAAMGVGMSIVLGIAAGLEKLKDWLFDKAADLAKSAVKAAADAILPGSPSRLSAAMVGVPIALGIAQGMQEKADEVNRKAAEVAREAVEKAAEAVRDARGKFADAMGSWGDAALSAFDKITSQHKTKTEKLLEQMDIRERVKSLKDAIAEASSGVSAARVEVETATAGGDPEAIAAANQKLIDAEKQKAEALAALNRYHLEQRAIAERVAYEKRREQERVNFEEGLIALQARLRKQVEAHKLSQNEVTALLGSYLEKYKLKGQQLGAALARGLRDSAGGVVDAANELAAAIARALGVAAEVGKKAAVTAGSRLQEVERRAIGGPVRAGTPYIVGERGPEVFWPGLSGAVIPNSNTLGAANVAGGGITVNVYGSVTAERDLAETLRVELLSIGRYNAGGILGGLA